MLERFFVIISFEKEEKRGMQLRGTTGGPHVRSAAGTRLSCGCEAVSAGKARKCTSTPSHRQGCVRACVGAYPFHAAQLCTLVTCAVCGVVVHPMQHRSIPARSFIITPALAGAYFIRVPGSTAPKRARCSDTPHKKPIRGRPTLREGVQLAQLSAQHRVTTLG